MAPGRGRPAVRHAQPPRQLGHGLATDAAAALLARGFADGLDEVWAVTDPDNHRSIAVCRRIEMRLLGVTHRWYHEPSLMFWVGAQDHQQPSLAPDQPAES
jgi:RimJ/RimL family protein N-acetyltransferase